MTRLFSASTKIDRQTKLNDKREKFLLSKFFATLHLRALPEIFVLHYYFFAGNASVLVDPEQSLGVNKANISCFSHM